MLSLSIVTEEPSLCQGLIFLGKGVISNEQTNTSQPLNAS